MQKVFDAYNPIDDMTRDLALNAFMGDIAKTALIGDRCAAREVVATVDATTERLYIYIYI